MKSYEEIAQNVFRRRDEYFAKRERRIAVIKKTSAAAACCCVVTVLGIVLLNGIETEQEFSETDRHAIVYSHVVTTETTANTVQTDRTQNTVTSAASSVQNTSSQSVNTTYTTTAPIESVTGLPVTQVPDIQQGTAQITAAHTTFSAAISITADATETTTATTTVSVTESSASVTTTTTEAVNGLDPCWPDEGFAYILRESENRANTVYIDPKELENGDYIFNASLYILGDLVKPSDINSITAQWDGYLEDGRETKYIRFNNCSDFNTEPSEKDLMDIARLQAEGILAEGLEVSRKPTCLSLIYTRSGSSSIRTMWSSHRSDLVTLQKAEGDYAVYSAGENQVYIINDENEKEYYTLTVDDITGTAVCEEAGLTIKNYDPDVPAGEFLMREANRVNLSSSQRIESEWFGGRSDVFPVVSFDVLIDKDTPDGIYYVAFDSDSLNKIYYIDKSLVYESTDAFYELDMQNSNKTENWLKIVVGDTAQ